MSTVPHSPLQVSCAVAHDIVRVQLSGNLDHTSAHVLLGAVSRVLVEHPGLRELRLHFTGVDDVDSTGLAELLMIRRQTDASGIRLHLENRPLRLERLLHLTGTLDYLTDADGHDAAVSEESRGARSGNADRHN
ncbi:STAS domain-containing protein [Streptomyces sp. NPDC057939]|uniref:STAS domain-containing protein n=1 Tax=Streptomyces sp. NPDC057939 TaxID=3346284 RepID=UPI0036F0BB19